MRLFARNRSLVGLAALWLVLAQPSYGISIYDVVRMSDADYSDADIIALIEATGSAFELDVKDIPDLKRDGVSESVIQAMLAAVVEDDHSQPGVHEQDEGQGTLADAEHSNADHSHDADPRITGNLGDGVFSSRVVHEYAAGGHGHQLIELWAAPLFILRDENGYPTIAMRARSVIDRLQRARSLGPGNFEPTHADGTDAIVFRSADGPADIVVVSVSPADAEAYTRRSDRRITTELLSAYWSDLLSDHWSIAFRGQAPTRLAELHEGDALQALATILATGDETDAASFQEAVRSMPPAVREHLDEIATTVPRDFRGDRTRVVGAR